MATPDELAKGIQLFDTLSEILMRNGYARVKYWCQDIDSHAERIEYVHQSDIVHKGVSFIRFYGHTVSIVGLQSVREVEKTEYEIKRLTKANESGFGHIASHT